MSDISIPGVTSRYNTDKMIEDLMKVERTTLKRLEDRQETQETEKKNWQRVNRYLGELGSAAKTLFGFSNPFAERTATSSAEKILSATVDRGIEPSVQEFTVNQTAAADRFQSRSLSEDTEIAAGDYTFLIGDNEVSFSFKGGDLDDLAAKINSRGEDLLRASVIRNTPETKVLLISSQKTGAANPLFFKDAAQSMALETGILKKAPGSSQTLPLSPPAGSSGITTEVSPEGTILKAAPGSSAILPLENPADLTESMMLSVEIRMTEAAAPPQAEAPPGPSIPGTPGIDYSGLRVESYPYDVDLPETAPPEPPPRRDTAQILTAKGSRVAAPLPEVPESGEFQTMEIPIGEYLRDMESLEIKNENTHRRVEIRQVRLYDPAERGEYIPAQPLSTARDAKITMDGVEVTRGTNDIDDLLPGVNLHLKRASSDPVELTIEPNQELIKDSIINFVGYYNQLMTEINILTQENDEIIQEVNYFTDDEREAAEERLGTFRGDITLSQMKNRLQQTMMNSYPTRAGREMALLSQIGISTNASGANRGFDASRLRGYLEIDENTLDEVLNQHPEAAQELFGRDTDGDKIIDTGVAYQVDAYLRPFTQTGGILDSKFSRLDTQIDQTKDEIEDYKEHLTDYEQELKQTYGQMEGTLQQMEQQRQSIERLRPQSGQ